MTSIKFKLPKELLKDIKLKRKNIDTLAKQLVQIGQVAGTDNPRFLRSKQKIEHAIAHNIPLSKVLLSRIDVRALALTLPELSKKENFTINKDILKKIDACINNKPTHLLIELLFQYFLTGFESIENPKPLIQWLRKAKEIKNQQLDKTMDCLLSTSGPAWIAQRSIKKNIDFDDFIKSIELDNYSEGSYIKLAKKHYYIQQLKGIKLNSYHPLLNEVKKENVYRSRYNDETLIGHQVLDILLKRIYDAGCQLEECWLKVILSIAGDPRVSKSHSNYRDWWQFIEQKLKQLVITCLSREDLRIFLDVIHDYARSESHNDEIQRMYPSRKRFLEGLLDAELIKGTRLYLSRDIDKYLKKTYSHILKELPNYSIVKDGDKSLIFIDLGKIQIIEGSHSCYLRLYNQLHKSAYVFDYNIKSVNYGDLTSEMQNKMEKYSIVRFLGKIRHEPRNFNWQKEALGQLDNYGINIRPDQVLTKKDYLEFKKIYGANEWKL